MSSLQPVRGTRDLLFDEARKHHFVIESAYQAAQLYGFEEIITPIFESTSVFARTLGEASDIVSKEMYTFLDRGGDSLTLRPENTAGVARAVISNGLFQKLPLKFFYAGPMFRYERPQKGRYRQFYQIGVETLGVQTAVADAEAIALGYQLLKSLKIENVCQLKINSLGDEPSRSAFRAALVTYLEKYKNELSPDSQNRLIKNPLRILDSKDPNDQKIVATAPRLPEHLTDDAKRFRDHVFELLAAMEIPFQEDLTLVRGLDYYTHTVFEFVTTQLGAQDAVLAGGRYDGLLEQMGGSPTPGVGWAAGVERLSLLLPSDQGFALKRPVVVLPMDDAQQSFAIKTAESIRRQTQIPVEVLVGSQLGKRLKKATQRYNARVAIIIGEDEMKAQKLGYKDLDSGEQRQLSLNELVNVLRAY
jgi:histidyl-tRNA synthetase